MLWFYFITTILISFFLTPLVIFIMRRTGIIDRAKKEKRKIHKKHIPLGGGIVIFVSFFVALALAVFAFGDVGTDISKKTLLGVALGGLVIIIGGLLDDAYTLRPRYQIIFPVLASSIAILSGIGIESISHPTGGIIHLTGITISVSGLGKFLVLADLLVFFWLMGLMMSTKFLDGLDGLVSGIAAIGGIVIFFVSRQAQWFQPEVGLVSLLFAAACIGFLVWNFHPAKIFLGEGGSVFTGYMLGVLALISGSKIATTLLVMGFPMLDLCRVIIMRLLKKRPVFVGDQEHLHFRLIHSGLSQRQAVLLLYSISLLFGLSVLFLQQHQQVVALGLLGVTMLLLSLFLVKNQPS